MVSHDYDLVKRVPRTVFLADGKIVRDELTGENYDLNQQELYEMMYKGQAGEMQDTAMMTVREHVSRILDDRQRAARRLKEELLENSTVDQDPELIYQAILDEVNARAHQAERDGKPTEVRSLWKILLDATE